jgi:FlaA1/EpsC-like NDP-sugar epimerase
MGKPVKIIDMVHDLIRLAGREVDSVAIRYIGLRPGEKLHEKLFYNSEQVEQTDVDKIFRVIDSRAPANIEDRIGKLLRLAYGEHDDELKSLLFASVASSLPIAERVGTGAAAGGRHVVRADPPTPRQAPPASGELGPPVDATS